MTDRSHFEIETWGTILFIDCEAGPGVEKAIAEVRDFVHEVDQKFSTYKQDSYISQLRRGEITIEQCPDDVGEVWDLCLQARALTDGAFDPWAVPGGFDPSGFVKGWAADRCIQILKGHGVKSIQINAAGDLSLAGGYDGGPWSIGIRHPDHPETIVKVFEIIDGAIATSGTYERGAHIIDPFTHLIAIGARSATVVGADGGLCDALATALIVLGKDGASLFQKPELSEYGAWIIERHSDTAWGFGRGFTPTSQD
jgi:FAD:protein FMN transferase